MANVETKHGGFEDLGKFKSKKCFKINNRMICEIKFSGGRLTILDSDLRKVCK